MLVDPEGERAELKATPGGEAGQSPLRDAVRQLRPSPRTLLLAITLVATMAVAGTCAVGERETPAARAVPREVRELVTVASLEPVELALEAGRLIQPANVQPSLLPVDHRIAFRVSAASIHMIDLAEGRMGPQRLGLELWSASLDPVGPDRLADRAVCRQGEDPPCAGLAPGGGRIGVRVRDGEYGLRVEVTNILRPAAERHRVLRSRAGMAPSTPWWRAPPCDVREDAALKMLVARAPEDAGSKFSACGFLSTGAVLRGGIFVPPVSFLKLEPDGTPRFSVRCPIYVTVEHGQPQGDSCELQGYLGIWPLFLWVRSDRAAEWEATFERVRNYLSLHVIARTD